jgi:hypothetical protein
MLKTIGKVTLALLIGALVFTIFQAFLAPIGWGMGWAGTMMHSTYAHPFMRVGGSYLFALVWMVPFVFLVSMIVWLVNGARSSSQETESDRDGSKIQN